MKSNRASASTNSAEPVQSRVRQMLFMPARLSRCSNPGVTCAADWQAILVHVAQARVAVCTASVVDYTDTQ